MWKLVLSSIVVCFCSTFQIYQNAIVNNLYQPASLWLMEQYDNNSAIVDWEWSILAGVVPVGKVVGTLFSGELADHLGRTGSLRLVAFMMSVGGLMTGLCTTLQSIYYATVGRFIIGIALGIGVNAASLFLTETPPKEYRGRFGSLTQIFFSLGDLMALGISLPNVLGTETLWPLAMAFACIPGPVCFVILLFTPESPRYLMVKCKSLSRKALKAINFFQGKKYVTRTMDDILVEAIQWEQSKKVTYWSLFKGQTLKPLLIATGLNIADQMTGINAVIAYSTLLMQQAGFTFYIASYCTFGLGLIKCVSNFPVPTLLDKFGRRPIIIAGLSGCAISHIIAIIGLTQQSPITVAVALALYMMSFSLNSSGICVVTTELFLQKVRGKAMVVAMSVRWSIASLVTTFFVPVVRAAGSEIALMPFVVISAITAMVSVKFLPETSQKTFTEIMQENFDDKQPTRVWTEDDFKNESTPLILSREKIIL